MSVLVVLVVVSCYCREAVCSRFDEGRRKEDEGRRREKGRRKMWKKETHITPK